MMDKVSNDMNIEMNYTNAQDHVPEAERNIRTIKERVRTAFHHLPYKRIPKIMIQYFVIETTRKLNLFPVKRGVLPYYSPHVIMTQTPLEYKKHCAIPFGRYVQAIHESNPNL